MKKLVMNGKSIKVAVLMLVCVAAAATVISTTDALAQGETAVGKTCTVYFADGEVLKFRVTSSARDKKLAALIMNANTASAWVVEIDNKTVVIPMSNVLYLEIDPAMDSMGVSLVKGTTVK
jgi:hypothetical protein